MQMMQKELSECYKTSGVNFVTDCKEVRMRFPRCPSRVSAQYRCQGSRADSCVCTLCVQLAKKYSEHIKGIGFSRANLKPDDKVTWGK